VNNRGIQHRAHTLRGFTMIEMIVALAMVAIVAASLTSSLWASYHTAKQAEAAVAPTDQASIALEYLCDDLQNSLTPNTTNAQPLVGNFEAIQSQDTRGHEADNVQFFTTAESPQHEDANGEIKFVQYLVEQPTGSSDFALVRQVTRNLLPPSVQPQPDEEILCRNVNSLTLQYYDGSNWNTTWDSTAENNELPAAVQVVLELEETAPNGKTELVRYTRNILLNCSMATLDPAVNSGTSMP
jgi:type II secretion system protein J